jgi:hypothetical protein
MKRLTRDWARVYLYVSDDTFSIPNSYQLANSNNCCWFTCVWLSPMHCESEPVIGGCPSVNNQSKLLFIGTTPRTVREPMCDEVGCLHPRATRLALVYISRVKGR